MNQADKISDERPNINHNQALTLGIYHSVGRQQLYADNKFRIDSLKKIRVSYYDNFKLLIYIVRKILISFACKKSA